MLLLTLTFSVVISELSRGFADMPVCDGVNGLFVCFDWFCFIIQIFIHARFSFKRKISHSSSHPFIRRPFTLPPI